MKKIIVDNLKYRYPLSEKLALDNISFEVEEGEVIGIVGKNLSGKSTLAQALIGLVPQFYRGGYGGSVLVDGIDVSNTPISQLISKVGIVFQNPFTQITGSQDTLYEEVAFGLENLGIDRETIISRVDETLKTLNIYEFKDRNPFKLSGGQMQRMAIASVVAMKPEVIILDEPTSQLDPKGTEEVFGAIRDLKEQGKTIIIIEHKIEKLAKYSDRILLLADGKLIDIDTPKKVLSRDDLLDYGVNPPVYTNICKKLNLKDKNTGYLPTTLKEAYEMLVMDNG